ncbi:MAG: class I SAM-dependent methyltransferase [Methanomassiliicoccus sp.]|nr:class I SAM-dependent methyltransferase [Methanomassiliicoccus sp.]
MDWAGRWATSIRATSRERLNSGLFWDRRVNITGPSPFLRAMTSDQIKIIAPSPHHNILEIGPGNGRLTIPLAQLSASVTSIDPSPLMLRSLSERAREEGLTNLRLINDCWENVDVAGMGRFDKIVSSFSIFMLDIEEQIRRMDSIADKVYLFVPADLRIPFAVQEILFGRIVVEHTDFEILSNIAEDLGLKPITFTMDYPERACFDNLEVAMEHYFDFYGVPDEKKELVAENLRSTILQKGGQFTTNGSRNVGVIWWQNS